MRPFLTVLLICGLALPSLLGAECEDVCTQCQEIGDIIICDAQECVENPETGIKYCTLLVSGTAKLCQIVVQTKPTCEKRLLLVPCEGGWVWFWTEPCEEV